MGKKIRRETYENGVVVAVDEVEDDTRIRLEPIEIVALFTPVELGALEASTNLQVVAVRTQFFAAIRAIDSQDPRFLGGIDILQAAGILTAQRAQAVKGIEKPQ